MSERLQDFIDQVQAGGDVATLLEDLPAELHESACYLLQSISIGSLLMSAAETQGPTVLGGNISEDGQYVEVQHNLPLDG